MYADLSGCDSLHAQIGPTVRTEVNVLDHRYSPKRVEKYRQRGFGTYMPKGKLNGELHRRHFEAYTDERILFEWDFIRDGPMPLR